MQSSLLPIAETMSHAGNSTLVHMWLQESVRGSAVKWRLLDIESPLSIGLRSSIVVATAVTLV